MILSKIVSLLARIDAFLDHHFRGSFGLNQLDLKLIDAINPSEGGFYVELGANDGVSQSNTYILQKQFKWKGVLIEPSPIKYIECLRNRDFSLPVNFLSCLCPNRLQERFVEIFDSDLMRCSHRSRCRR